MEEATSGMLGPRTPEKQGSGRGGHLRLGGREADLYRVEADDQPQTSPVYQSSPPNLVSKAPTLISAIPSASPAPTGRHLLSSQEREASKPTSSPWGLPALCKPPSARPQAWGKEGLKGEKRMRGRVGYGGIHMWQFLLLHAGRGTSVTRAKLRNLFWEGEKERGRASLQREQGMGLRLKRAGWTPLLQSPPLPLGCPLCPLTLAALRRWS